MKILALGVLRRDCVWVWVRAVVTRPCVCVQFTFPCACEHAWSSLAAVFLSELQANFRRRHDGNASSNRITLAFFCVLGKQRAERGNPTQCNQINVSSVAVTLSGLFWPPLIH